MKLRLYHYWRSSSSWRVRWALLYKNISCEYVTIDLLSDEQKKNDYINKNPFATVPTLEVVGENIFLTESLAIIGWLDDLFPKSQRLIPLEPWKRFKVMQLSEIINSGIQPIQNLRVQKMYSDNPIKRTEWAKYWIALGLKAYETLLQDSMGFYSCGDELSLADLCLIPQIYNAKRNGVDLSLFPKIMKIEENCLKLDSCIDSSPDRVKL